MNQIPGRERDLGKRPHPIDARGVHHDVNRTAPRLAHHDRVPHTCLVGDVYRQCQRVATKVTNQPGSRVRKLGADIGRNDGHALGGERPCRCLTNSATRTGHQCHATV